MLPVHPNLGGLCAPAKSPLPSKHLVWPGACLAGLLHIVAAFVLRQLGAISGWVACTMGSLVAC